jgi:hypothetical protein
MQSIKRATNILDNDEDVIDLDGEDEEDFDVDMQSRSEIE